MCGSGGAGGLCAVMECRWRWNATLVMHKRREVACNLTQSTFPPTPPLVGRQRAWRSGWTRNSSAGQCLTTRSALWRRRLASIARVCYYYILFSLLFFFFFFSFGVVLAWLSRARQGEVVNPRPTLAPQAIIPYNPLFTPTPPIPATAHTDMGGVNAAVENNQKVEKQIRVLENRLDKSLVKFNSGMQCARCSVLPIHGRSSGSSGSSGSSSSSSSSCC